MSLDTKSKLPIKSSTKKKQIAGHFRHIMKILGLDVENDDSLQRTPERVAKMYVDEIFSGLDEKAFPKITTQKNSLGGGGHVYDEMVTVDNIAVKTVCEHHFVPFIGTAKISYIPKDTVVGLSKINRVVDYYCRRPQVQEKLTLQIFTKLVEVLGTQDVAVLIKAEHFCVKLRGIKDNSITTTTKLGGEYLKDAMARNEFLNV